MSMVSKLKRKIISTKKTGFSEEFKKIHLFQGNLFDRIVNDKKATNLYTDKLKSGVNVCLTFEHDESQKVKYHFKYNSDRLLLLRGTSINNKMVISENSIPDFAISAKPLNANCKPAWIPQHGSVSGVTTRNEIDIICNVSYFTINQSFCAVNPNEPNEIMWKHHVTHKVTVDKPYLEISNQIEIVQDTEINRMYLTMLPANSKNVNHLYLSNGIMYDKIPNDGVEIKFNENISSAMYVGGRKNGLFNAIAVGSDSEKESSVVTFREDGITKFYVNEFCGIARKGAIFKNTQRIACVSGLEIPDLISIN